VLGRAALAIALVAFSTGASAQGLLPPVTDRNFAIDLYQGPVLGSARVVGMGGASVAAGQGSAGVLSNPAAVAVWPATSTDKWDWDFHFDYLNRLPGEDLDNNGIEDAEVELEVSPFVTGGLIGRWGVWAVGATVSSNNEAAPSDDPDADDLVVQTDTIRIALGASLFGETLAVGAGFRVGRFDMLLAGERNTPLFDLTGTGLEFGVNWAPAKRNWRLGAALSTPVRGGDRVELRPDDCDPLDCEGYILPERVVAPWQLAVGGAWRFGPTKWNQKIGADWRDERSLVVAADLIVIGSSPDAYGIGAFAQKRLQRSGASTSVSARAGLEYEWIPGRLRVRTGSYWEPGRFDDVSGRLHFTLGIDGRVWSFCFWEDRYRVLLGVFGDGAEGYGNGGVTLGFWH